MMFVIVLINSKSIYYEVIDFIRKTSILKGAIVLSVSSEVTNRLNNDEVMMDEDNTMVTVRKKALHTS